jgi:hypothetical protein
MERLPLILAERAAPAFWAHDHWAKVGMGNEAQQQRPKTT